MSNMHTSKSTLTIFWLLSVLMCAVWLPQSALAFDVTATGINTLRTGNVQATLTEEGITASLTEAGVKPATAREIARGVDGGISLAGGVTGSLRVVTVQSPRSGRVGVGSVGDDIKSSQNSLNGTKGVGGNGAASELGNLSGKSASEISNVLKNAGFSGKSVSPSSYQKFVHKDGSVIWVNWKSGRITRHPSPKYGPDGRRINRGQRLDSNGAEVPKSTPHNEIQENFKP